MIALLTEDKYLVLDSNKEFTRTLQTEESMLLSALLELGLKTERVSWQNAHISWRDFKSAVFRSTWDYHTKPKQFINWINSLPSSLQLINPKETILWNINKRYLFDFQASGIRVPKTSIAKHNSTIYLDDFFKEFDCEALIIKPMISAGARDTFLVHPVNQSTLERQLNQKLLNESFLIQEFLPNVLHSGEISSIVIDGKLTHSVRKVAKPGDFRVQDDHGGTVHPYSPSEAEIQFVLRVNSTIPHPVCYARVDYILDGNNEPTLMEYEAIEPELFFRFGPSAATALASVLAH